MVGKRRKRRNIFDLFGFEEESFLGEVPAKGGSGYSMSVTYDGTGKPVVQVKTSGEIDSTELRREIEKQYPGARIVGLEEKPLIRVIREKKLESKERESEATKGEQG